MEKTANGSYAYSGYLYDIWKLLAGNLNLQYRMVEPEGWGFGSCYPNSTCTGMVGELFYGRADVALTWLLDRPDRAAVVDFIHVPIEENYDAFHIVGGTADVPQTAAQMAGSLLRPLHAHVWWAVLGVLLVLSVALRVVIYFNQGYGERSQTVTEMTFGSCLFYNYMSLVGQSWAIVPTSSSARIVTIISWMINIIIVSSFTANLISDLAVVTVSRPIGSLREFTEQPDWKLAIRPGHGVLYDWQMSRDQYERELYRRSSIHDRVIELDNAQLFQITIQPKVMTFFDIKHLKLTIGDAACSLVPLLDQPAKLTPNYFAIAKGQPALRRLMYAELLRMSEMGLIGHLKRRRFSRIENMCTSSSDTKAMSLGNTLASIALVPLGVVLGLAIAVLENLWARAVTKRHVTGAVDRQHFIVMKLVS
ncbi:glutamate receptor 1-like [Amphibalanus amphitrite]|uniref:glutamate receptor 1-like n=1 Tax=Amphibalanus amphitrite TaxID=1232801 RepID=UPI001C92B778|nr:glutamate receptor 1-like [Amphibalanus amphitrite]